MIEKHRCNAQQTWSLFQINFIFQFEVFRGKEKHTKTAHIVASTY